LEKKDRLRALRILNGLTQSELAVAAKLRQPAIASCEGGRFSLKDASAHRLADVLMVAPGYLTSGRPLPAWIVWTPRLGKSQVLKTFLQDIESLLPEFWRENGFSAADRYPLEDGSLVQLRSRANAACLLLIPQLFAEIFVATLLRAGVAVSERGAKEMKLAEIDQQSLRSMAIDEWSRYRWRKSGHPVANSVHSLSNATGFTFNNMVPVLECAFQHIVRELNLGPDESKGKSFANLAARKIVHEILDLQNKEFKFAESHQESLRNALDFTIKSLKE
jgi:transcriptional regulator with XRE-family HTH domain